MEYIVKPFGTRGRRPQISNYFIHFIHARVVNHVTDLSMVSQMLQCVHVYHQCCISWGSSAARVNEMKTQRCHNSIIWNYGYFIFGTYFVNDANYIQWMQVSYHHNCNVRIPILCMVHFEGFQLRKHIQCMNIDIGFTMSQRWLIMNVWWGEKLS